MIGRAPDVMIPSDREIARAVNEGTPIVLAQERSDAARAFGQLVDYFSFVPPPEQAVNGNGGLRSLLRRH